MNENTFSSERNHTRLRFEPLTTSCHVKCLSDQSPCAQTIDTTGSTAVYNPNRLLTPTFLYPDCRASDHDNVFTKGSVNSLLLLDSLQWLVNGNPINEEWTVNTDYVIDTSATDTRGMLTVYKNLPASGTCTLKFTGTFVDWRTKAEYRVESEEVMLVTTDKGVDKIAASVDKSVITYDPLYDNLLLYDYLLARGLETAVNRSNYVDGQNYLQTVGVLLTVGSTPQTTLPTGVTMRLVRLGQSTALEANSEASPEVASISYPSIVFDMRMIESNNYEVQFLKNSVVIAHTTVGLHRKTTMPTNGKPLRNADMPPALRLYTNIALMNLADRAVEYPELYYMIKWFTQSVKAQTVNGSTQYVYDAAKEWQRGQSLQVLTSEIGVGHTANDSHFQLWFDVDPHPACELIGDEDGETLTDENGEMLID